MKLKIIRRVHGNYGEWTIKEHPLKGDGDSIIGRSTKDKSWVPDIDLLPDRSVSRRHTRLAFRRGCWNVTDLESMHGTLVGDDKLGKDDPARVVEPGEAIKVGNTILVMDPAGRHRALWQDFSIAFDFPSSINYSLFHCGIPLLRNISVLNVGDEPSKPFFLCFQVPGYSKECRIAVPGIPAMKSCFIEKAPFMLLKERLEGMSQRARARIEFAAYRDRNELKNVRESAYHAEIWVLGFYEWSEEAGHRKTLAAFVQPGNPAVQSIVSRAERHLEEIAGTASFSDLSCRDNAEEPALNALYECLRSSYHITYVDPPVSYELKSQVIRPPHRIMTGFSGEKPGGEGTCIDLVLLMAACLEYISLHPLIILVKENDWIQHAFAGCWKNSPFIHNGVLGYDQLNAAVKEDEVILLECTGFARNTERSYDQAVWDGLAEFTAEKFLYALNIVQLRQDPDKITPIENQASPEVLKIIRFSEELARGEEGTGHPLHTVHLLYGFRAAGTEVSRRVLINVPERDELKKNSYDKILKKSRGFIAVFDAAKDLARRSASPCMEEHHLLWALLYCGRENLRAELKKCGLGISELRQTLDDVLEEKNIKINPRDDSYCVKEDIDGNDENKDVS